MYQPPRVILLGLGPIGARIGGLIHSRKAATIVGAIDIDPAKVGRDVGEILGLGQPLGVTVSADLAGTLRSEANCVIMATGSTLESVFPQVEAILSAKKRLLTTCEELIFPRANLGNLARRVDELAKAKGEAVLGTGVNPGFTMDLLPCILTALSERVEKIRIVRRQDARIRRDPFQRKIGAGLSLREFEEKRKSGMFGHVGLRDSLEAIAKRIGWRVDRYEEEMEPIVSESGVSSDTISVPAGYVAGMRQWGRGFCNGKEAIVLEMAMALGLPDPEDVIFIEGQQNLVFRAEGGIHGDGATAAIVVNALPLLMRSEPGLHTAFDLPPIAYYEIQAEPSVIIK